MDAGIPRLLAVDHPLPAIQDRRGLHVRGIRPVAGFGDAECEVPSPLGEVVHPRGLPQVGAIVQHQQQTDVVAHDRVLILQVAVQPQAVARQMLPDDRHSQVGAVHTAVLHREGVTVKAGVVGTAPCFGEQRLPFLAGQAAAVSVGPGVLAPVIEKPDVVVLPLQRADLTLDELIDLREQAGEVLGEREIHGTALLAAGLLSSAGLSRTRPTRWQPLLSPA